MKNILVVAVHPDDETLGCGGTLRRFKTEGSFIHWLIVTSMYAQKGKEIWAKKSNGETWLWRDKKIDPVLFAEKEVERRAHEVKQVGKAYSFDSVHEMCLPAMCVDQIPMEKMINRISDIMHEVRPDTVILPFKADVHSDHRVAFEAAYSCTKRFRYPFVQRVMMMETISETDFGLGTGENMFCPNVYVNISNHIQEKIDIMALYGGEMASPPFPRSTENIRALALNRGCMSSFEYAEGYMLLKEYF